jgi:hypothetical protein
MDLCAALQITLGLFASELGFDPKSGRQSVQDTLCIIVHRNLSGRPAEAGAAASMISRQSRLRRH